MHIAQLMPVPLTVSCFSKIQIGFTCLVPAHPGSPGKKAVKRVCVCGIIICYYLIRLAIPVADSPNITILLLLLLHPCNGLFSRTSWVSRYHKGKTSLDLNDARDDGVWDAVASAGPYANNLHVAPDRLPQKHLITQFCRPDALPDAEPTVSTAVTIKQNFRKS